VICSIKKLGSEDLAVAREQLARMLKQIEPAVEAVPLLCEMGCAVYVQLVLAPPR
jgi:hypothetical protein